MTIVTLFVYMILGLAMLCILYWGARLARPLLGPLRALGADSDSMGGQVFPLLAFTGALVIMLQLTLF